MNEQLPTELNSSRSSGPVKFLNTQAAEYVNITGKMNFKNKLTFKIAPYCLSKPSFCPLGLMAIQRPNLNRKTKPSAVVDLTGDRSSVIKIPFYSFKWLVLLLFCVLSMAAAKVRAIVARLERAYEKSPMPELAARLATAIDAIDEGNDSTQLPENEDIFFEVSNRSLKSNYMLCRMYLENTRLKMFFFDKTYHYPGPLACKNKPNCLDLNCPLYHGPSPLRL